MSPLVHLISKEVYMLKSKKLWQGIALSGLMAASLSTQATIVTMETSQGNITINLFDETTPKTVDNFLTYVNAGDYNQSVIHRSVSGFITQGGGFTYDGDKLVDIAVNDAVVNEPVYSNVKGTIAMAKKGGQPDSATIQWFFNLSDNAANLDVQNGGFTVFGQVIEGMDVVEKIAGLKLCNIALGSGSTPAPLDNVDNCSDAIGFENFVSIANIDITDASENTSENLNPVKNTLINKPPSSSSGGAFGLFSMLALGLVWLRRQRF